MSMLFLALVVLHLTVAGVLGYGAWAALQRIRICTALLAGLAGYHVLALPSVYAFLDQFGVDVVIQGELVALLGAVLIVGVLEGLERVNQHSSHRSFEPVVQAVGEKPGNYLVIALSALAVVVMITARRGVVVLDSTWEDARDALGFADSVATLLLFMALPVCWVVWRSGKHLPAVGLFLLSLLLISIYGSRAAFLTIPAIVAFDLHTRRRLTSSKSALMWGAIALLLAVMVLHVTGRFVRGIGLGGLISIAQGRFAPEEGILDFIANIDWTGGESDIFGYYYFVLSENYIPGVEPMATVLRWVLMYVPRSWAVDLKPIDPTYMLWTHAANSGLFDGEMFIRQILDVLKIGDQGSLHPTFWGEAWMNGGWLGLVVMCSILPLVLYSIDRILLALPIEVVVLVAPATIVGYLMVARGNSTIGLGYFAYILPVAWCLVWAVSKLGGLLPKAPVQRNCGAGLSGE
ncbi:MAG: hypothetical protein H6979_03955 [Chromatiales bacterium]|nr:hypothetical protein [Chromatiales bacterium]